MIDRDARLAPALRLAIVLGLVGVSMLTLLAAFTMGSRLDRHIGTELTDAIRLPLSGWSLTVGDLRVAHFFATHMMQVLPLAGLVAIRLLPGAAAVPAVLCVAAAWTALTLHLYQHALRGDAFWRL